MLRYEIRCQGRPPLGNSGQFFQCNRGNGPVSRFHFPHVLSRRDQQFGLDLPRHALRKIDRRSIVHWHNNNTANRASEEGRDPLRAVLAPHHHTITLIDAPRRHFLRERTRQEQNVPVSKRLCPISSALSVGALVPMLLKILQKELSQRFGHGDIRDLTPQSSAKV